MADNADFDDFVVARSHALLRTAYLLVQFEALAEDLLQTALTKAWFAWGRIEGGPKGYVRRILVNTAASWWHRRWRRELPTDVLPESGATSGAPTEDQDLWGAVGRLPARQRAVVVLRYLEDRTEVETHRLREQGRGCSWAAHGSRTQRKPTWFVELRTAWPCRAAGR
jgi:RNA polymerase sigma-70 factor (sigma-E family)